MESHRRLTAFSHGAGCGCKLGPSELQSALGRVVLPGMPSEVLVDAATSDDAAVYRLPSGDGIVATVDFFTPIVDDPYDWGRIAATNAMSDVFAMGGRPFLAMNIVSWPVEDLGLDLLGSVLQGGIDAATKAGVAVVGGHSITDPEPKYGMVVLGTADPGRIVRNSTSVSGATLFLTKPLGLGIVSTAVKRGSAPNDLVAAAVELMTTTNEAAAEAMLESGVAAATDVTGFGLLGHLREMLLGAGLSAEVDAAAVPMFDPRILELARADVVPGGTKRNLAWVRPTTEFVELQPPEQLVLADAQTSGGLLIATTEPTSLAEALGRRGVAFSQVGTVHEGDPGTIRVTGTFQE